MKTKKTLKATPSNYPGNAAFRLNPKHHNPREIAFATQWLFENELHLLSKLIGRKACMADIEVAATVIQWLGSNVGMSFLDEVARNDKGVRDWFRGCGG